MHVYIFSPPSKKLFDIIHSFIIHTDKNKVSILSPSIDLKPMPVLVSILSILVQHRIPYWSGPQFILISVEIKTSGLNTIILSTGHARKQKKTVSIKCLWVFHKYVVKCDISRRLLPLLCNTGILNLVLCRSGYLKFKKCLCSCVHQSEQRQETKQEKRKKIIAMHGLGKGCNFFC